MPEDLSEWLSELNLSDCVTSLQKNMVLAFVDGTLIANIIHRTFPRLILLQSYEETSNVSKRTTNWQLLNRKVLNVIHCELGNEDISKIVAKNYRKNNFHRLSFRDLEQEKSSLNQSLIPSLFLSAPETKYLACPSPVESTPTVARGTIPP